MTLTISMRKLLNYFFAIIIILILLSVSSQIYKFEFNSGQDRYITNMLNVDKEMNFPTLYATLTLFFCSFLIFVIGKTKKQFKDKFYLHWLILGLIFFFMGIDEILMLHEQLSAPVRGTLNTEGILYFSWLIPAAIFLVLFLFAYLKFFFSLNKYFRILFLSSAVLYVFGAFGMEVIGSRIIVSYGQNNLFYALITNIEELFEMIGILVFIYSLLSYIKIYIQNLNLRIID